MKTLYSLGQRSGLPKKITEIHFDTLVRQVTKATDVPDSVANHIVDHAWRQGTKKVLDMGAQTWVAYCRLRGLNLLHMTRNTGLNFLEHIAQMQPGYYPIRDAKFFLINFNKLLPNPILSQDMTLVDWYLWGCFNTPAHEQSHLVKNWDINILLDHLDQQTENQNVSLNELGGKAAMLILLAKMCLMGELTLMDINRVSFSDDKVTFHLIQPTKTINYKIWNPKDGCQKLSLTKFHSAQLCPVETVYEYIQRTKPFCNDITALFIVVDMGHRCARPASASTLSHWAKTLMTRAGLHHQTVHSGHGSAATMALLLGLPFHQILQKVGWIKASTFINHYMKPLLANREDKIKDYNRHRLREYWDSQDDRVPAGDCHKIAKVDKFRISHGTKSDTLTGCSERSCTSASMSATLMGWPYDQTANTAETNGSQPARTLQHKPKSHLKLRPEHRTLEQPLQLETSLSIQSLGNKLSMTPKVLTGQNKSPNILRRRKQVLQPRQESTDPGQSWWDPQHELKNRPLHLDHPRTCTLYKCRGGYTDGGYHSGHQLKWVGHSIICISCGHQHCYHQDHFAVSVYRHYGYVIRRLADQGHQRRPWRQF